MPNQLPQGPASIPTPLPRRLLGFSLFVFIVSVFGYLGLVFGYKPYLEDRLASVESEFAALAKEVPAEAQEKVVGFYSQILNVQDVLKEHIYPSRVFAFVEATTNQKVFWNKMTMNAKAATLILEGVADSYGAVTEQLEAYARRSEVVRANLDDSAESGGRVRFRVALMLKHEALRGNTENIAP